MASKGWMQAVLTLGVVSGSYKMMYKAVDIPGLAETLHAAYKVNQKSLSRYMGQQRLQDVELERIQVTLECVARGLEQEHPGDLKVIDLAGACGILLAELYDKCGTESRRAISESLKGLENVLAFLEAENLDSDHFNRDATCEMIRIIIEKGMMQH